MSSRGPIVIGAALALCLVISSPALAEQMQAKDAPKASENLSFQGEKCATDRDEHDGKVVAVVKACQRFYTLNSDAEDDAGNDYGVFWLQTTIDPKPGWCVTTAKSDMVFPARAEVVARTPDADESVKKAKQLRTNLSANAGGHAATAGSISQTSTIYPDKQTPSLKKRTKTTRFRVHWTGSSGEQLAFVSGVHFSWAADDGPPRRTRFGLRKYKLVEKETC